MHVVGGRVLQRQGEGADAEVLGLVRRLPPGGGHGHELGDGADVVRVQPLGRVLQGGEQPELVVDGGGIQPRQVGLGSVVHAEEVVHLLQRRLLLERGRAEPAVELGGGVVVAGDQGGIDQGEVLFRGLLAGFTQSRQIGEGHGDLRKARRGIRALPARGGVLAAGHPDAHARRQAQILLGAVHGCLEDVAVRGTGGCVQPGELRGLPALCGAVG
ncbi:MAG: hypothetical protein L0H00_08205 [Micrococcales bacterium]|nr:hypothetical protein [Micrococcales bacterium]